MRRNSMKMKKKKTNVTHVLLNRGAEINEVFANTGLHLSVHFNNKKPFRYYYNTVDRPTQRMISVKNQSMPHITITTKKQVSSYVFEDYT